MFIINIKKSKKADNEDSGEQKRITNEKEVL